MDREELDRLLAPYQATHIPQASRSGLSWRPVVVAVLDLRERERTPVGV